MITSINMSCPFCRSLDLAVRNFGTGKTRQFHVNCHNCGADGPLADGTTEAWALWNERPNEPQRGDGTPPHHSN